MQLQGSPGVLPNWGSTVTFPPHIPQKSTTFPSQSHSLVKIPGPVLSPLQTPHSSGGLHDPSSIMLLGPKLQAVLSVQPVHDELSPPHTPHSSKVFPLQSQSPPGISAHPQS